jgi:hypothetical protein
MKLVWFWFFLLFSQTKKEGTNYEVNQQRKKSEGGWFSGLFGGGKKSKDKKTGRNS